MKAKISFSSVNATSDPVNWIYKLEDAGFQGWEIVGEGLQKLEKGKSGGEFRERVREIHETTNLFLSLHTPLSDINIASVNERIWAECVRQLKESIENAYEFIDDICVVHPGFFSPLSVQTPEKAFQKAIAGLTEVCEFAADRGLRVAVENLTSANMLMGRFPDELVKIVRGVRENANSDAAENLGICLDVGHANTTKTLDEFFALRTEIIHLHASDNFGAEDLHLPLGRGNLDWKKVFEWVRGGVEDCCGYEGLVVFELYGLEEGRESLEFVRRLSLK